MSLVESKKFCVYIIYNSTHLGSNNFEPLSYLSLRIYLVLHYVCTYIWFNSSVWKHSTNCKYRYYNVVHLNYVSFSLNSVSLIALNATLITATNLLFHETLHSFWKLFSYVTYFVSVMCMSTYCSIGLVPMTQIYSSKATILLNT